MKTRLAAKVIDLRAEGRVVILSRKDGKKADLKTHDRVEVGTDENASTATIYFSDELVEPGVAGVTRDLAEVLRLKDGDEISLRLARLPGSFSYVKKKMRGESLSKEEMKAIIGDLVSGRLGPLETLAFAMAEEYVGMSMEEVQYLTESLVETGEVLRFDSPAYDKHSIGGVPGNKVSLLIVPIVASGGLLIPKTSSRSITSPSGTADTMEVLANVEFDASELMEIVSRVNASIVWGGMLNLAPGDDAIIRVEHVVGIDPESQMMASILAKKLAAGVKYLVLDVPTGKGAKVQTLEEAGSLSRKFIELGNRLGVQIRCGITYGEQPIGHAVGPALEAREALRALLGKGPTSLTEKSVSLAGLLLEMGGRVALGGGYGAAKDLLRRGKAHKKMLEIIEAQGGDPDLKPRDIPIGRYKHAIHAPANGYVTSVSNRAITAIARAAGAPEEKGAGLMIHVKRGHKVKKGQRILEIFAERSTKLQDAVRTLNKEPPIVVEGMLLKVIPEREIFTTFYPGSK
ncbi:MAG: AMP phosphorylase [Candidatus Bathyarchaeia archaeon]